jgi:hypothetical protein
VAENSSVSPFTNFLRDGHDQRGHRFSLLSSLKPKLGPPIVNWGFIESVVIKAQALI